MQNNILELQEKQFGRMHDFLTERTANMIEAIYEAFGEEAINILDKSGVDFYGLFRWHIEKTLSIIDTLKEVYVRLLLILFKKMSLIPVMKKGKGLRIN